MAWGYGAAGTFVSQVISSGAPTLDVPYPAGITAGQLLAINYYSRASGNLLSLRFANMRSAMRGTIPGQKPAASG